MAEAPNSISEATSQVQQFVRTLSVRQRLLMAGGAIAVAVMLFVFVRMINRPEMKTLASSLKPADAQAIASRLALRKIAYELSPDGSSIQVPADKLDESRIELAAQSSSTGARLGFELFDKTDWVGSDFDDKVNYQRALEGELERTLQTLGGVDAVRVHLVLPPDSVFTERDRQGKASVVLKLRGRSFTRELHGTIAQLVASSVDKLEPQQVTVVDGDTGQKFALVFEGMQGHGGESLEQALQSRLLQTLEPVLGADHVRASVRVEYDMSSNEETQESYDPNGAVALSTHKTEEQAGTGIGGVPGAASNVIGAATTKPTPTPLPAGPQSRSENNTYAVSRRVRHSTQPAGAVKRIAAALLVDDARVTKQENGKTTTERQKRTPEQLQQIEQLAKAAIGIDITRGDVLTVANMSFEQSPVEAPPVPGIFEKSRRIVNDWSWVLRLAAIGALFLVVYMLVLRPIRRQIVEGLKSAARLGTTERGKLASQNAAALDAAFTGADNEDARRLGNLKKQLAARVSADPAVSTRLVQNWIGEAE